MTLLNLGRACMDAWRRDWRAGRRGALPRGRPSATATDPVRLKARELLEHTGPATGVSTLMGHCPTLGRNEAAALLANYREECRAGHYAEVSALRWTRPGAVWALDHTHPPGAVDGLYPYVLLVRDLATHFQVGAMPQSHCTDRAVAAALTDLFRRHGAPLVLKSDNHGSFTGRAVRQVLDRWGVLALVSPPYLPRYNGAIEAGVGQFQTLTHYLATKMDHPGVWTSNDVEGARIMANRTRRPWEATGPTPEEAWKKRRRITWEERLRVRRAYQAKLATYDRNPPADFLTGVTENPAVFEIRARNGRTELPAWAKRWNGSESPGHRRPWNRRSAAATPAGGTGEDGSREADQACNGGRKGVNEGTTSGGQKRKGVVYYQRLKRRSLTDVLVDQGFLLIRRRRIPLPIKRVMRLKIS